MTQRATPTFAGTQEAFFQKASRVELDIIWNLYYDCKFFEAVTK